MQAVPGGTLHAPAHMQAVPGGTLHHPVSTQAVPGGTLHTPAHMQAVPGGTLYPPAHAQDLGHMAAAPILQPQPVQGTTSGYNMIVDMRPLDAQVDPKIKAKNCQDEYINLVFPHPAGPPIILPSVKTSHPRRGGHITTHQAPKGSINSIVQWNQAWRVYMIVALKNPSHTPEQHSSLASQMIHYMHFINTLYGSGADYLHYDENFRDYRQYNPTPFSSVDHCLQMEAQSHGKTPHARGPQNPHARLGFHRSHPQGSQAKTHPSLVAEARSKLRDHDIPRGYCYLFLASLPCYKKQCQYKHNCPYCGAKHPIDRCLKPAARTTQRQNGRGTVRPLLSTPVDPPNTSHLSHYRRQWLNTTTQPTAWAPDSGSLKQSVPPVINIEALQELLVSYDPSEAHKTITGFRQGFDIGYRGPITDVDTKNLSSALRQPLVMQTLIQNEVNKGRFFGGVHSQ